MRTVPLDVRFACRLAAAHPWQVLVIVVALAFGLGANAAVFSLVDALLLRPFKLPGVDRLVIASSVAPTEFFEREAVAPGDFLDWKARLSSVESLAALEWWDPNLVGPDEPERLAGFKVSPEFFTALGINPVLGRVFRPEEAVTGADRLVILGHGLWSRRFAADPDIVGRDVLVNGAPHVVVGVAPPGFSLPMGAEIWSPLPFDEATARKRRGSLIVVGRLAEGRSLEDARAELNVVVSDLRQQFPDTNANRQVTVRTFVDGMADEGAGPFLAIWQASAVFLLLVACANVANLLLARGADRQRELAVRLALGANRQRIVRQLMVESLLLALVAAAASLVIAWVGIELIRANMPPAIIRYISGWEQLGLQPRTILVTLGLAAVAALVFGLLPAFQASRPPIVDTLRDGSRGSTSGGARARLRYVLAGAQIALALMLLAAAGLSIASARRAMYGPVGFDADGVMTASVTLPDDPYADAATRRRFSQEVVTRLAALPGVDAAAAFNAIPYASWNHSTRFLVEGAEPGQGDPPSVDARAISARAFDVLRIPILRGRALSERDDEHAPPVAVVSQLAAARFWPGEEAVGKRFRTAPDGPWIQVVGVCGDVLHSWFMQMRNPTVYRPMAQDPSYTQVFLLRTQGSDPAALAPDIRTVVRAVDPAQPIWDMRTMRTVMADRSTGLRYAAGIMSAIGGIALLLAALGVYSVMAYVTARRTQEFGVRMALGATPRDVLRMTLGQTVRIAAAGIALGLGLAVALGRLMQGVLFGSVSLDPRPLVGTAVLLAATAVLSGYITARRAAALDPTVALRAE